MGARLLKRWLAFPLKSAEAIKSRHLIVDWFFNNLNDLEEFQNKLKGIMKIKLIKKNKLKTNINKKFKKISLFELQNSPKFLNFRVRA